jgi:hypothetical protein
MKILEQKAYSYLLMEDNDEWYLTFFTGGPVEIDICVKLNQHERDDIRSGELAASELVQQFLSDKAKYESRRIIPSVRP